MRKTEEGKTMLSTYRDSLASDDDILRYGKMIHSAYPSTFSKMTDKETVSWMLVFSEAVKFKKMTATQLRDATMHCITETHKFGDFQISDVTNFSKEIQIIGYNEFMLGQEKGSIIASDLVMLKNEIDYRKNKWIRKADAVREEINIEELKKILNNY